MARLSINTQDVNIIQQVHAMHAAHADLSEQLLDYLEGSEHDVNWEGFTRRDLYAIRKFFIDFGKYVNNL